MKTVIITVLVLIAIILLGGVYYARVHPDSLLQLQTATTTTTTTTLVNSPTATVSGTTFLAGNYHNSVYGLTLNLPANYQPIDTGTSPAGVVASDSIEFTNNGQDIFSINVFTKQQWNVIRTEENTEHLNVNNLGEGTYLGENETYIFSYSIATQSPDIQSILSTIRYY